MGFASCATPTKIEVSFKGEEPAEVLQIFSYALPQTILKVEVVVRNVSNIPGPYWESANKYLGITEVSQRKSSSWSVENVIVTPHSEMDPRQVYSLNLIEGEADWGFMNPLLEKGIILDGTSLVHDGSRVLCARFFFGTGLPKDVRQIFIYPNFRRELKPCVKHW